MTFKLTFNKPAISEFFHGEVKGLRLRMRDGKLHFKPTDNLAVGIGVIPVVSRKRGGFMIMVTDSAADKITKELDFSESLQLGLRGAGYGWVEAHHVDVADEQKVAPHVRVWPNQSTTLKVTKRGPGRPRKDGALPHQKVAATARRKATPTVRNGTSVKTSVKSALGTLVMSFLSANPDFIKEHPELQHSAPKARRKSAKAKVARSQPVSPAEQKQGQPEGPTDAQRKPRRTPEQMEAFRAEQATRVKRKPGRPRKDDATNGHTSVEEQAGPELEEIREDMTEDQRAAASSRNAHRVLGENANETPPTG